MLFFFRPYQLHHVYANVSPEQPYTRTIFHFDSQLADELLRPSQGVTDCLPLYGKAATLSKRLI